MTTNKRYRIHIHITDETPAIEHDLKALLVLFCKLISFGKTEVEIVNIFMASFDMTRDEAEALISKMMFKAAYRIMKLKEPFEMLRSIEDGVTTAQPTQSLDGPQ